MNERVKLTTTIDEEILKKFKILSIEKGIQLNKMLDEALELYITNNTKKVDVVKL